MEELQDFQEFLKENDIDYELYGCEVDGRKAIYCHFENKDADFFQDCIYWNQIVSIVLLLVYPYGESILCISLMNLMHFTILNYRSQCRRHLKKMSGVQIFTTTHNTDLMSNDLLRPDSYFLA